MGRKVCCACGDEKDEEQFNWRNKAKGLRQAHCKPCQKERGAAHYQANKSAYKRRARDWRNQLRRRFISWITTKSCVDCGETDPVVLQCDHVRGKKSLSVSRMLSDAKPWETIEKELAKCDVRCANCHTRRTAKQFGWLKQPSLKSEVD